MTLSARPAEELPQRFAPGLRCFNRVQPCDSVPVAQSVLVRSRSSEQNRLNQQHRDEAHDEAEPDGHGERQHLRPSNFDHPSHRRRK